jgi:membrane associated rhomboid family serine protease
MRRHRSLADIFTFGGHMPAPIGGLICAIVAGSLLGRLSTTFAGFAVFVPELVWQGQVWRLVTWVFMEGSALSLLFTGLMLFWFGRDLCYAWGTQRFLATYFGVAVGAGLVTCLIARFLLPGALLGWPFAGAASVSSALVIAWGMIFPERQMLYQFLFPISGRTLVWLTPAVTLLFAILDRALASSVPDFAAQALIFGYARGWSLRGFWQSLRIRNYERRARRRASHLKVVNKNDPPKWMN